MIRQLARTFDGTTMYRLVLMVLALMAAAALGLSFFKLVDATPDEIALSLVVLLAVCAATNAVLSWAFRAPAGKDSWPITALILLLIMPPAPSADLAGLGGLAFAALWATASKYLLAIGGKHIFNPAAVGAVLSGVLIGQAPTWWAAGSIYLLPLTVVGGILIAQKLRRFDLVIMLIVADLAAVAATSAWGGQLEAITETVLRTPLLFFAVIMATEPHSAPQQRWARLVYAVGLGVLLAPAINFWGYYPTPELVLLAANLFAFLSGSRRKARLTFLRQEPVGGSAVELVFKPDRKLRYQPGQYMEWILPSRGSDARGNRRFLTIASAPGDEDVRLGVKVLPEPSEFKRALLALQPGDRMTGALLGGGFVLPRNRSLKLAFIAGGIGITPFASMLRHLLARGEQRSIVLLYGNEAEDQIAYRSLLDCAETKLGLRTIHTLLKGGATPYRSGFIDAAAIREDIPDYEERLFYLSGPPAMVGSLRRALLGMGVSPLRIKTDFFPGLG